jgi:tetratricopeptide (TPR) repeat protein
MRKRLLYILIVAGAVCPSLWCQNSTPQEIARALTWNEQGQYDRTIELTTRLLADNRLTTLERARVWNMLAVAYHEEERYPEAGAAYEQALRASSQDPASRAEYAAVLTAYAILSSEMLQNDTAWKMLKRALQVSRELNDDGGMAAACKGLANLALAQHRTHSARPYLRCAMEHSAHDPELNEDYFAAQASTEAWLDELDHRYTDALVAYRNALRLWQQKHGETNLLVGWGYMLLGKVCFETGHAEEAGEYMRKGLEILERTAGRESFKFLIAELAYAPVLDASGAHDEARTMKTRAKDALELFYRRQCTGCSIGVDALSLR